MKKKYSIIIFKFIGVNLPVIEDAFRDIKENEFDPNKAEGFRDLSRESEYLTARLIQKSSTYINDFNAITRQIDRRQIDLFLSTDFGVDYEFLTMDYFGARSNFSKFQRGLINLLGRSFALEEINISVEDLITELSGVVEDLRINRLVVSEYNPLHGVIGKFDAKIFSNESAEALIAENSGKIIKCEIDIFGELEFNLSISNYCSLKLQCEEQNYSSIVYFLKKVILKQ